MKLPTHSSTSSGSSMSGSSGASVAASDDTCRIEMECAFPCPTAARCCSCYSQRLLEFDWPKEHGGPTNASTLSSKNNLMIFPVVTLLLHAESNVTKLQRSQAQHDNELYAHLRSDRSHLKHPFQYFWVTAVPPKRSGARENSLLSPFDGPGCYS